MLLFYDIRCNLQILDIQSKKLTLVDKGEMSHIGDYEWSGDSNWVIYTKESKNRLNSLWVYSLPKGKSYKLSSGKYNDLAPCFSQCGKFIFFISDRDFNLNFQKDLASLELDFVYNNTSRLYAMALTKDAPNLFKEKADTAKPKDSKAEKSEKTKKEKKGSEPVIIDFDGIEKRVAAFPLETAPYNFIVDIGGKVLYGKDTEVRLYDLKTRKDQPVIKGVRVRAISADHKKLLYQAGKKWGIIDMKPNQKPDAGALKLDDLEMKIDPVKEWRQIFNEGWRIYRDWFYVENMHGVDWQKLKEKYAALLPYVSHRMDLDYIFGELVSELNVGHAYVSYGDFKKVKRMDTGLLGAELTADKESGRYKITKIYTGENWNPQTRSPLTEQEVDVKEGDYIIRLNDFDVFLKDNPYLFLENTAGKKITITVNSKPTEKGARTFWIKPIKSEQELFYLDWVESRRKIVDQLSNGRIGYIHVPDTAVQGHGEFFKGMYAYNDKEAFIIDDRYNKGGITPVKMIRKMAQRPTYYWYRRNLALAKEPIFALEGPMVMLINHLSASGGDDFPYWFKKYKLGKLIGTRTWGGLVGIGWSPGLVDGASFGVPDTGFVSKEGEIVVEGIGVYPDKGFEVYDRPEEIAKGKDPSIEAAVKYLLEQLEKNPPQKLEKPKEPDRSKWHEKMKEK
jgi:tricorn protease